MEEGGFTGCRNVLLVTDASLEAAARPLSADKGPASANSYELRHGAWVDDAGWSSKNYRL